MGISKTLKSTAILYAVPLFILMLIETRGDFANGILFFIHGVTNVHVLLITVLLFGLTLLCGKRAGREVIINEKNFTLIAFKYTLAITLALVIYIAIAANIKDDNIAAHNISALPLNNFIQALIKIGLKIFLPLLAIWLWAANSLRIAYTKIKTL